MITRLFYRLGVLALLMRCAWALTDILNLLARLYTAQLARAVRLRVPPASERIEAMKEAFRAKPGVDSKRGGPHGPPAPSSSASRSGTTPTTTTTEPTAATGRWTPTSGLRTEAGDLRGSQKALDALIKTSSPTGASSTGAGSPGPAPASSGSTPEPECPACREKTKERHGIKGLHHTTESCRLLASSGSSEHDELCEDSDVGMGLSTGCACAQRREAAALPEHNHVEGQDCGSDCPARFHLAPKRYRSREEVEATGHQAICIPKLGDGPGHDQHAHVPGEELRPRMSTLAQEVHQGLHDQSHP